MRKLFLASLLAVAALAALPERSHAWGRDPYNGHGYGWLGSKAFRKMQWIHQAPLYSYGPYYGPGYVNMHIPQPYHGHYTPADQSLWNNGYGQGYGYGAPAAAPAPAPAPAVDAGSPHAAVPIQWPVVPAAHRAVYPAWLNYR